MDKLEPPKYDENKEIEAIYDYHNCQIFRVNTENTNLFLEVGKSFDEGCVERVDKEGRVRIIYVVDKIPPLSAILKFVSNPFDEVLWGIYAVIVPQDLQTLSKITPILSYALGITKLKGRFTLKVFESKYRNDLTEVVKWMDECMEIREAKIDVKNLEKIKAEIAEKRAAKVS